MTTFLLSYNDATTCGGEGSFEICELVPNTNYEIGISPAGVPTVMQFNLTTDANGCITIDLLPGEYTFTNITYEVIIGNLTFVCEDFVNINFTINGLPLPTPGVPLGIGSISCLFGTDGSIRICDLIIGEEYEISYTTPTGLTTTILIAELDILEPNLGGCVYISQLDPGAYIVHDITQVSTGCNTVIDFAVDVPSPPSVPVPIITANEPTICDGPGSFEACGLSSNSTYLLFFGVAGTGLTLMNVATDANGCFTLDNIPPGDYTFGAIFQFFDCITNIDQDFTIDESPPLTIPIVSGINPTSCINDGSIEICNLYSGADYTITLILPDGTTIMYQRTVFNTGCVSYSGLGAGTYIVQEIVESTTDCAQVLDFAVELTVQLPFTPDAPIGINPTTCVPGDDGSIEICGLIAGENYTSNLTLPSGLTLTLFNMTADAAGCLIWPGLVPGTYTVGDVIQESTGCTATIDAMVTLTDPPFPPVPTILGIDATNCGGDGSLEVCGLTLNTPYTLSGTYNGIPNSITFSTGGDVCRLFSQNYPPGTYNFDLIVDNSTGCGTAISIQAIINDGPLPTPNGPTGMNPTNCDTADDGSIEICGLIAGQEYTSGVTFPDGSTTMFLLMADAGGCVTYTGLTEGPYTVQNIVQISTSCESVINESVTLTRPVPPPIPMITTIDPINCNDGGSLVICGLLPNASYTIWLDYEGTITAPISITTDPTGCSFSPFEDSGDYYFDMIENDLTGCITNFIAEVTINPPPIPTPDMPSGTDPTTCDGTEGTIEICGLIPNDTYTSLVTFPDGTNMNLNLTADVAGCVTMTGLEEGSYEVLYILHVATNCLADINEPVVLTDPLPPTPEVPTFTNPTTCDGTEGTIEICGLIPSDTYSSLVTFPDGINMNFNLTADAAGCVTITGLEDGSYEVLDIVHVNTNCLTDINETITLTDPPLPTPDTPLGTDPITCDGTEGEIEICGLNVNDRYIVSVDFPDGSNMNFDFTSDPSGCVTITSLEDGTYDVLNITHWLTNCLAPIDEIIVLTDPPLPTPVVNMVSNPTTCGGTEGEVEICGLLANNMYNTDITYPDGSILNINFTTDAVGCGILKDLYEGSYLIQNVTLNSTICSATIDLLIELFDPPVPMPTTIVGIDPFMCGACDGRVDICGLMPNETYEMMFTMPNGNNVALTYYTDVDGCSQNNTFFEGTHVLLSIRRVLDNCVAIINQTIVLTDPLPPSPYPAVAINPTECSALDGEIELCDLARYESYSIQLLAPDGTITTENYSSNGDGCLWIRNLSEGTYVLGILVDNTTTCSTTLNEAITLTGAPSAGFKIHCPADISIADDISNFVAGTPEIFGSCGEVTITVGDPEFLGSGGPCKDIFLVIYTGTDAFGNSSICSQEVAVEWDCSLNMGNRVFFDAENDGILDSLDKPVINVRVNLWRETTGDDMPDEFVRWTRTDSSGVYMFYDLEPGDYIVEIPESELQANTVPSSLPVADPDNDMDDRNDAYNPGITGMRVITYPVTLNYEEEPMDDGDEDSNTNLTIDIGLIHTSSLGSYVWKDLDADGLQDADEGGVNGVIAKLYKADNPNTPVDSVETFTSATTNQKGYFMFTDIIPGAYFVTFELPSGYVFTAPLNGPDNMDSNVDGSNGHGSTGIITIGQDQVDITVDAGIYPSSAIGSFVWLDMVGGSTNLSDAGDRPLPNVEVTLWDARENTVKEMMVTDANGHYLFEGMPAGHYFVEFNAPQGYSLIAPNFGDDTRDSDADPISRISHTFSLDAGETNLTIDAGYSVTVDVDLVDFDGSWNNFRRVSELNWITASEINTKKFILERSDLDDETFKGIHEVAAQGNSSSELRYEYNDETIVEAGIYYYRLKIVDYNGDISYSDIVAINVSDLIEGPEIELMLFPHATQGFLNLEITSSESFDVSSEIYDMKGALIALLNLQNVQDGVNSLQVNVSDYAAGVYMIRVKIGNKEFIERFTKVD